MSKATGSALIASSQESARTAVLTAGIAAGLRERSAAGDDAVVMVEPFRLLSFSWPAKLQAVLSESSGGTQVDLSVSNFGFGPVQGAHVKVLLAKVEAGLTTV